MSFWDILCFLPGSNCTPHLLLPNHIPDSLQCRLAANQSPDPLHLCLPHSWLNRLTALSQCAFLIQLGALSYVESKHNFVCKMSFSCKQFSSTGTHDLLSLPYCVQ